MARPFSPAVSVETAHDLALGLLDTLDYLSTAADRATAEPDRFAGLAIRLRELSSELNRQLMELAEPFILSGAPLAQAGDFCAESAHNLVCTLTSCLWCDLEFAVADAFRSYGREIVAVPAPDTNLVSKLNLALTAFRNFAVSPTASLLNRLRADCRREYILVGRAAMKSDKPPAKVDTKKLSTPRRHGLTPAARRCAKTYKAKVKAGEKTTMKAVILDYIGENDGSFSSIQKSLSDNPEAWKVDTKVDKRV